MQITARRRLLVFILCGSPFENMIWRQRVWFALFRAYGLTKETVMTSCWCAASYSGCHIVRLCRPGGVDLGFSPITALDAREVVED